MAGQLSDQGLKATVGAGFAWAWIREGDVRRAEWGGAEGQEAW